MKNNLIGCKVGDYTWSIQHGWERIIEIDCFATYQIKTASTDFTFNGRYDIDDIAPSAFIEPPLCFNPVPKPESVRHFKKGERVLVGDTPNGEKRHRYFAEYKPNNDFPYVCFDYGGDEWSSKGKTTGWKCCEKAEE